MKRQLLHFAVCVVLTLISAGPVLAEGAGPAPSPAPSTSEPPKLDSGDTAWMLGSTGLVLLMVPGLALFYGGMVRRKNVLGTMMQSMVALGVVGVQWLLFGYCLAFGESQSGFIGWSSDFLGLWGVKPDAPFTGTKIPIYVHCMYQGMFAIITPALISGAVAERIRFGPYCLFLLLWTTLVYDPLAHWVWAVAQNPKDPGGSVSAGWLGDMGALDFAGGTVVHIAAGFSALAAILILPRRRGYPEHAMHPNSMVLTLTGAGILWFGWFGFNGGSALAANPQAGLALGASQVAAAAAALSWMIAEWLHRGKPTALGLASGLVAGLVAITPASGFVSPMSALAIGLIAGLVCYTAVCAKPALKYDDSLDAFGVHGIGGFLGALFTGVFASYALWLAGTGNDPKKYTEVGKLTGDWLAGRGPQMGVQLLAASVAAGYAFGVSFVLVKGIDLLWGFGLTAENEGVGLDQAEHNEVGFDFGPAAAEEVLETRPPEPRSATVPPDGHGRYTVVVEGPKQAELMHAWSEMCQTGKSPPAAAFVAVYPYVTTVQGNRFRFRGGDRVKMRGYLQALFQDSLGETVHTHVEE
jgi:ammonium transporter, Amt family